MQPSRHPLPRHTWVWWAMLACVIGGPLVMLEKTGYLETWEATERYTLAVLAFSAAHPISVPGEAPAEDEAAHAAALRALDRRLIAWHRDLDALYDRICAMAVVSTLTDPGASVSLTYDRPAGVGQRALKREFHAKRDASILLYLALTAAVYFSNSVLLASLVLVLNVLNLLLCYRIKVHALALGSVLLQIPRRDAWRPLPTAPPSLLPSSLCKLISRACRTRWRSPCSSWTRWWGSWSAGPCRPCLPPATRPPPPSCLPSWPPWRGTGRARSWA
uniref:PRA1 family protein n=1 Tax=Auxenochlorella protothecoides TaxID=3075 RepID=A0A1D2A3I7_AUXPR